MIHKSSEGALVRILKIYFSHSVLQAPPPPSPPPLTLAPSKIIISQITPFVVTHAKPKDIF